MPCIYQNKYKNSYIGVGRKIESIFFNRQRAPKQTMDAVSILMTYTANLVNEVPSTNQEIFLETFLC